ncbi:MAG: aminomethyl-transferring glycine dehydrogenase [Candidatus Cloacimonadota bacterium]|nr:MAG: aminomethyl-transferring glycine dehydrogenase [Candidatus Cloacimonadota bacterium]
MSYISNTDKERKIMLKEIGVESFEELTEYIPKDLRVKGLLNLDKPMSELELIRKFNALGKKNKTSLDVNSFLGGGVYDHFTPAAVDHITLRPEFHSAYTPYQAEVSQGTLQFIYEFQTMICELTGMETANAGMYDGATAAAEAVLMSVRNCKNKKMKAVIAGSINPEYLNVIKVYTEGAGIELDTVPQKNGLVDLDYLKKATDENTACVLLQTPNFFGNTEDVFAAEKIAHSIPKTLFIVSCNPVSLALLNSPAEFKADIVTGEGQSLGNSQNFGGPLFGFFATSSKLSRQMPGRIAGGTVDQDGKRAYALTLQAREQHIRRAKATSNICSNQSLCTLAAVTHLSLMGSEGLIEAATQSTTKAHYLAQKIAAIDGYELAFDAPFFNEFVMKTRKPVKEIIAALKEKNIFAGIDLTENGLKDHLLIAVTEKKSKEQMDEFAKALAEV